MPRDATRDGILKTKVGVNITVLLNILIYMKIDLVRRLNKAQQFSFHSNDRMQTDPSRTGKCWSDNENSKSKFILVWD